MKCLVDLALLDIGDLTDLYLFSFAPSKPGILEPYLLTFNFFLTLHIFPAHPDQPGGLVSNPVAVIYAKAGQGKYRVIGT